MQKLIYIVDHLLYFYWKVFCKPLIINLVFQENYTGLDWRSYFLNKRKWLKQGYLCLSRQQLLAMADKEQSAIESINEVDLTTFKKFSVYGLRLWEINKASILSELNKLEVNLNTEDLDLIKKYFVVSVLYMNALEKLIASRQISAFLVSQGTTYASRLVVELAQRHGITTVALENCFIGNRFYADNSTGVILNRHALATQIWHRCRARKLSDEQYARLNKSIDALYNNKNEEHRVINPQTAGSVKQQFNIPDNRKIAVLLGQVMTDASLVMDSDIFTDPVDFIIRTIDYFKNKEDWYLIVRLHPYEAYGITNSAIDGPFRKLNNPTYNELKTRNYKGGDNYCVLEGTGYATDSIMRSAMLGITLNSQSGFEMLLFGKPVVTAARAFYAYKGLTIDVPDEKLLKHCLDIAISNPVLSDTQKQALASYAYAVLFEYSFPKDISALDERFERLFLPSQGYVDVFDQHLH